MKSSVNFVVIKNLGSDRMWVFLVVVDIFMLISGVILGVLGTIFIKKSEKEKKDNKKPRSIALKVLGIFVILIGIVFLGISILLTFGLS